MLDAAGRGGQIGVAYDGAIKVACNGVRAANGLMWHLARRIGEMRRISTMLLGG